MRFPLPCKSAQSVRAASLWRPAAFVCAVCIPLLSVQESVAAEILCRHIHSVRMAAVEPASEEKPAVGTAKEKVFYSQQANPREWGDWFADKKGYIQQTTALFQKAAALARNQGEQIRDATHASDARRMHEASKNAGSELSRIIKTLQELTPPEGLRVYHDKIIQSCQVMQQVIDSYPEGGSRYAAYTLNSVTLAMDAVKSLKELYAEHGASQENIDDLVDIVIDSFFKDVAYHIQEAQTKAEQ